MTIRPIADVAEELGIDPNHLIQYGSTKGKISLEALKSPRKRPGKSKLILVSAITPTPAGEGKTTTTIGVGQAMRRLGENVCVALRETAHRMANAPRRCEPSPPRDGRGQNGVPEC